MKKMHFLTTVLLVAATGFGAAYAKSPPLASGTYKLAIGSKAPCELTISDTGTVTQAADCATDTTLTKWKATSTGYELTTASGEVYAILTQHGDSYEGVTFATAHKLVLTH